MVENHYFSTDNGVTITHFACLIYTQDSAQTSHIEFMLILSSLDSMLPSVSVYHNLVSFMIYNCTDS